MFNGFIQVLAWCYCNTRTRVFECGRKIDAHLLRGSVSMRGTKKQGKS